MRIVKIKSFKKKVGSKKILFEFGKSKNKFSIFFYKIYLVNTQGFLLFLNFFLNFFLLREFYFVIFVLNLEVCKYSPCPHFFVPIFYFFIFFKKK